MHDQSDITNPLCTCASGHFDIWITPPLDINKISSKCWGVNVTATPALGIVTLEEACGKSAAGWKHRYQETPFFSMMHPHNFNGFTRGATARRH
ncbi:hypothetical protein chiPu_0004084 [Chiloscyllium punctatum]|uniref:Uncharacterized protein n=1 Tax=Chiloscyllium punctatum TaxID=137246 RepID=A0A401S5J3_CHIPU|nr:hypothetical protein [Chiloscyllium punctatum]